MNSDVGLHVVLLLCGCFILVSEIRKFVSSAPRLAPHCITTTTTVCQTFQSFARSHHFTIWLYLSSLLLAEFRMCLGKASKGWVWHILVLSYCIAPCFPVWNDAILHLLAQVGAVQAQPQPYSLRIGPIPEDTVSFASLGSGCVS